MHLYAKARYSRPISLTINFNRLLVIVYSILYFHLSVSLSRGWKVSIVTFVARLSINKVVDHFKTEVFFLVLF